MKDDSNHISLITKIRAMESKLLNSTDYNNLHSMNNIREIFSYLQEKTIFHNILESFDGVTSLHRNQLEHLLIHFMYDDFVKLYKFSNVEERNFLNIITSKFEINILKRLIAHIGKENTHNVTYADFFLKHSDIDFNNLQKSATIQEFASKLVGTAYYDYFQELLTRNFTKLSDYEIQLDIYYFKNIWKKMKNFKKDIQDIISYLIGTEMDLYNIKSIFRCKYFYHMTPNQIQNYIVPLTYNLKKEKLQKMIFSNTIDDFYKEFKTCYYRNSNITFDLNNIDDSFERVLNESHLHFIKKNPNSLGRVYIYFDKKNYEIHYTTKIIEQTRYKNTHI